MLRVRDSVRVPGRVKAPWWLLILQLLGLLAAKAVGDHLVFFAGGVIPSHFFNPGKLEAWFIANFDAFANSGLVADPYTIDPETVMGSFRAPAILTLFWAMFLHQGWAHFLSNAIALMIFGPNVEAYMGRTRFLLFYFSCGVFGFFCQSLFYMGSTVPIIGASGAISGLFGAYMVLFNNHYIRITIGNPRGFYRDIMFPVKALLIMWILSQVFYEVMGMFAAAIPGMASQNIAFFTHIGGFVCGFFLANGKDGPGLGRRKFKVFTGGRGSGSTPYTD